MTVFYPYSPRVGDTVLYGHEEHTSEPQHYQLAVVWRPALVMAVEDGTSQEEPALDLKVLLPHGDFFKRAVPHGDGAGQWCHRDEGPR